MLSVIIWNWEINLHCIFGLIIHYMSTVSAGDNCNCNCNVRKRKIWNVLISIFERWGIGWKGEWNTFSRSLLTQFLSGITQNWFIETKNYTTNPSSHSFQLFPTTKLHPIFRCREFFVCRRPKGVYWFIFSNAYIISELFKWISCSSPTVCILMFILCYRAVYYLRPKNFS